MEIKIKKMKNYLILLIACVVSQVGISQINTPVGHATIESVKVSYKSVPGGTVVPGTAPQVQAIPEATIILKNGAPASKIYLKISGTSTNSTSTIYEVNYQTNSSVITSQQGKKLFENTNGKIFISNGQALPLRPYAYEIQTEDAQNNRSAVYSIIQ